MRDVVGRSGFGIGSAGLPAYNVLVEGYSQALDNDVVLSMKQANSPALRRFVDVDGIDRYFEHEGERTVVSQRAHSGVPTSSCVPSGRTRSKTSQAPMVSRTTSGCAWATTCSQSAGASALGTGWP